MLAAGRHISPPFSSPESRKRKRDSGPRFFETVKRTEDGLAFPIDFVTHLGFSELESYYLSQGKLCGTSRNFDGWNWDIHDIAENLQIECPSDEAKRLRREAEEASWAKYVKPTPTQLLVLRRRFSRFIFRLPTKDLLTNPSSFAPNTHRYTYDKTKGLMNEFTGVLQNGQSCTLRLTGYKPYLYFELPPMLDDHEDISLVSRTFLVKLNEVVCSLLGKHADKKSTSNPDDFRVNSIIRLAKTLNTRLHNLVSADPKIEHHINSRKYRGSSTLPFLKIETIHPQLITILKTLLQAPFGGESESESHSPWLPTEYKKFGFSNNMQVCEAHIDYTVRFLIDRNLFSCGIWWVYAKYPTIYIPPSKKTSMSDLEVEMDYKNVKSGSPQYVEHNLPIQVDSKFDIEVSTGLRFPHPDINPVTQIVIRSRFGSLGESPPESETNLVETPMPQDVTIRRRGCRVAVCFCLGEAGPSKEYSVLSFSDEKLMLIAFMEYMIVLQSDFIAGFYSDVFDWPYLLDRARILGLGCFPYFGRFFGEMVRSTAKDKRTTKKGIFRPSTHIPGITCWDLFKHLDDFMMEKTKSLNAMSWKYLEKRKIDVAYALIGELMKTLKGRNLLCRYCNYDVVLLELLDDKWKALPFRQEMANLCNTPLHQMGDRASTFRIGSFWTECTKMYHGLAYTDLGKVGQLEIKSGAKENPTPDVMEFPNSDSFYSLTHPALYHDTKAASVFFLTPSTSPFFRIDSAPSGDYEGGCVMQPVQGVYQGFGETLDFMSLYPTLIQALNLCHISYIPPGEKDFICAAYKLHPTDDIWDVPTFLLSDDQLTTTPYRDKKNPSFVRAHVVKGILCYMEEHLMAQRGISTKKKTAYEKAAAEEADPVLKSTLLVLAGIHGLYSNAKKILCNGLYGSLGMPGGFFSCVDIAATITRMARQALEWIRYFTIRTVRKSNGWDFNTYVFYGDTDSIFPQVMDLVEEMFHKAGLSPKENVIEVRKAVFAEFDKLCAMINERLPKAMKLQNEKMWDGILLSAPKQYALEMTLDPSKPFFQKATGMSVVRRGGCGLTRDLCGKILEAIIIKKDIDEAVRIGRETLKRVKERKLVQTEIIMRSSLSKEIDEYKMKTPPPQVTMAKKIMARSGIPMRPGDRVFYIVIPRPPKGKVSEGVEDPLECLKNNIQYDMEYYTQTVIKELKKLFRPVFDERTFAEKVEFSEWMRKLSYMPDGEKIARREKTKLKNIQDKMVESVFLHGREYKQPLTRPSFCNLPPAYQEDLPEPKYHWAGYDPKETLEDIENYNEPWNSKMKIDESFAEGEEVIGKEESREGEEEKEDGFEISEFRVRNEKTKDGCDRNIAFAKIFQQPKCRSVSPKFTRTQVKTVKAKPPVNSVMSQFLIELEPCLYCKKDIPISHFSICDSCIGDDKSRNEEREGIKEARRADLLGKKAESERLYNICVKCVEPIAADIENAHTLLSACDNRECSNWAPVRDSKFVFERSAKKFEGHLDYDERRKREPITMEYENEEEHGEEEIEIFNPTDVFEEELDLFVVWGGSDSESDGE